MSEVTEQIGINTCNLSCSVVPASCCILCGGPLKISVPGLVDTRFGIPEEYSVAECQRCGLEQIDPVPSPGDLKRLYESHYNFGGERETAYTKFREWFLLSKLYRLWMLLDGDVFFHGRRGSGRLLDLGCNEGRGLTLHTRNGFQAEGLELNERAAQLARQRGFTVSTSLIEDFLPTKLYNVVVLSNVLEHTGQPKQMLMSVRAVLNHNGEVWISCPNSRSWLRKLCGKEWINWHVPFHISHFSASRLRQLLEETGFTEIRIQNRTPSLWVASSVIAKLFAKRGRVTRKLRNPALVLCLMMISRFVLFPILWLANQVGHGDCLLATAKRA